MASGGGKKGKNDEGGFGSLFGFIGGAVLGAAAAYGIKKVVDHFNEAEEREKEEKRAAEKLAPYSSHSSSSPRSSCSDGYRDDRGYSRQHERTAIKYPEHSHYTDDNVPHRSTAGMNQTVEQMHAFYQNYVKIDEAEKCDARQKVTQVMHHFNRYLNTHMAAQFPVGQMYVDEVTTELLVVKPDLFIINIPIVLDPKMWTVIDGSQNDIEQRGYFMIKRDLESFELGECQYDSYLYGEYLAPLEYNLRLQEVIHNMTWPSSQVRVHPVTSSDHASVVVEYKDKQIQIDFVPLISLCGDSFIAEAHPQVKSCQGYEKLWRKSFQEEERKLIGEIRSADNGHQLQCLLTFLALHHSVPGYFGLVKKDVLKTVFYHLAESEDIWMEETLQERFIDMLKFLEEYLRIRRMPDFFSPYINILQQYPDTALHNLKAFISKTIGNNDFKRLLTCKK